MDDLQETKEIERYENALLKAKRDDFKHGRTLSNDHEGTASPRQMKVFHISQKQIMNANRRAFIVKIVASIKRQ